MKLTAAVIIWRHSISEPKKLLPTLAANTARSYATFYASRSILYASKITIYLVTVREAVSRMLLKLTP
jgi:hypothetical protein